jgi:hemerythrin superfamily protein
MAEHHDGGTGRDATEILAHDHKEFLALVGSIEGETDPRARRELADTLIAEIMRHAVAEEMFVYPAIKKHVPNGPEEVEHDKAEHQEIVLAMKQMEDVDASDPRFMEGVVRLRELLIEHASSEEGEQFPKLRAHIPREELLAMGGKVEMAKSLAPTRPHPSAPHSALFHKTVGPGVGFVDRLRDRLEGRHTG